MHSIRYDMSKFTHDTHDPDADDHAGGGRIAHLCGGTALSICLPTQPVSTCMTLVYTTILESFGTAVEFWYSCIGSLKPCGTRQ